MEMYDKDDPAVIKANAEAKARVLEARAKLHPVTQVVYANWDSFNELIHQIGCFVIILIIALALVAPQIITALFK